jgi:TonB-dependent starch-binding outer membrane protein SusC
MREHPAFKTFLPILIAARMENFSYNKTLKFMKKNTDYSIFSFLKKHEKLLQIMKLSLVINLIFFVSVTANIYSQKNSFTLNFNDVTVKDVIKTIESHSDYRFFYNDELSDMSRKVNLNFEDLAITDVLGTLFNNSGIAYRILENNLIVLAPEASLQQLRIRGTVKDANTGEVLPGVNIMIEGTGSGVVSDNTGVFTIDIPSSDAVLVFSYVGFISEKVEVKGNTTLDISLIPDITNLDEVVVIGYGVSKKTDLTGSLATISTKDFQKQDITRMDQVLQGRASGVVVENTGGAPGSDVKIRIRGATSMLGDNNPLYVVDGFVGIDFNTINPQDIEDIQILKDASATAIYGSRGANGVILVTTKQGKNSQMKVEFLSKVSASRVPKKMDVLSAGDFAEIVNTRRTDLGLPVYFTTQEVADFRSHGGTDWQDELFRTSYGQEYQLGLSGGNEKSAYYISGNYLKQDGIVRNSDFTRFTLRANITSQISRKFTVRLNLSGSQRELHNTGGGYSGAASPVTQALSWAPTTPLRDEASGKYTWKDPLSSIYYNPLNIQYAQNNRDISTVGNAVGGIKYEFIPGLTLDVGFGINYENAQNKVFVDGLSTDNNKPYANRKSNSRIMLLNTNILNYTKTFNNHSVNISAVFEQQKYTDDGFGVNINELTTGDFEFYQLSLGSANGNSYYENWALRSFLARAVYSFKDRYVVTASLRRDGSSKFQGKNQYSTFPSVGLAWRLSEEPFVKNLNLFDNLKLRASWGQTGNQAVGSYATLQRYSNETATFDLGNNVPTLRYDQPANKDLKWETTTQINGGIDLGFMKNRIGVSIDYFNKDTRDLLLGVPVPLYAGGGTINRNIGEMTNKGVEVSLTATVVDNHDFTWNSSFNFAAITNKIVALAEADTLFVTSTVGGGSSTQAEFVAVKGQPMSSYWGVHYLGTWKPAEAELAALFGSVPGDSRYEDLDGDHQITSKDFKIIGSALPKYFIGWNNTFTYKSLSLNIFLQGVMGFDKLNYTYAAGMTYDRATREAIFTDIKKRYIPGVNETSDIPAFTTTNKNNVQSTRFLEKGNYIRVKNISLSYELPRSLLKAAGIRLFINGTNLLTLTRYKGYDPESASTGSGSDQNTSSSIDYGGYPNARTITGGAAFTF